MAMPPLTPDFHDLLRIFNSHGVEYLLVGGYALGAHGFVRYTKDIDLWVLGTEANAAKVAAAVARSGFDVAGLSADTFTSGVRTRVVQMGRAPNRAEKVF